MVFKGLIKGRPILGGTILRNATSLARDGRAFAVLGLRIHLIPGTRSPLVTEKRACWAVLPLAQLEALPGTYFHHVSILFHHPYQIPSIDSNIISVAN